MKKLFILFLFFSIYTCVCAQNDPDMKTQPLESTEATANDLPYSENGKRFFIYPSTRVITYDFKSGKYAGNLSRIRVHTPVVFEIKNINPFAYKIKITPKDSVIAASSFDKSMLQWISKAELQAAQAKIDETEAIPSFQSAKVDVVGNTDVSDSIKKDGKSNTASDKSNTVDDVNKGLQAAVKSGAAITEVKRMKEEVKEIDTEIELKNAIVGERENTDPSPIVAGKTNDQLAGDKKRLLEKIEEYENAIKDDTAKVNATMKHFVGLYNNFMTAYSNYMTDSHRVFRIVRNANSLTTMAEDPNLTDIFQWSKYKHTFKKIHLEIQDDRNNYNNFRKTYSELTNLHALLKHDPELQRLLKQSGIDKLYAYPDYIKGRADALHARLVQIPIETYMKQSEWIATKFDSEDPFVYRSVPLQPINDWIEFKVDIAQKNGVISKDYYSERSFIFHQPTYGGTRVDFSLGLAGSYFWDTPVYELGYESPSDTSRLIIYEKDDRFIAPSLLGLVTMSVRRTKYAAYGGSAGLGIDVVNGKVQLSNFFIGPTLLLGKFDRIFLSGGASIRNVRELEKGYNADQSAGAATRIESILVDKYKVGIFFSVTYSLTDNAKKMLQSF